MRWLINKKKKVIRTDATIGNLRFATRGQFDSGELLLGPWHSRKRKRLEVLQGIRARA